MVLAMYEHSVFMRIQNCLPVIKFLHTFPEWLYNIGQAVHLVKTRVGKIEVNETRWMGKQNNYVSQLSHGLLMACKCTKWKHAVCAYP